MFEGMNRRTDGRRHGRRLESHPISSPGAFGSGELKLNNCCFFVTWFSKTFLLSVIDMDRRKPVFRVSNKVRFKPAYLDTETS